MYKIESNNGINKLKTTRIMKMITPYRLNIFKDRESVILLISLSKVIEIFHIFN